MPKCTGNVINVVKIKNTWVLLFKFAFDSQDKREAHFSARNSIALNKIYKISSISLTGF